MDDKLAKQEVRIITTFRVKGGRGICWGSVSKTLVLLAKRTYVFRGSKFDLKLA
jgi:hypothetical protein